MLGEGRGRGGGVHIHSPPSLFQTVSSPCAMAASLFSGQHFSARSNLTVSLGLFPAAWHLSHSLFLARQSPCSKLGTCLILAGDVRRLTILCLSNWSSQRHKLLSRCTNEQTGAQSCTSASRSVLLWPSPLFNVSRYVMWLLFHQLPTTGTRISYHKKFYYFHTTRWSRCFKHVFAENFQHKISNFTTILRWKHTVYIL